MPTKTTSPELNLIFEALKFASLKHRAQRRKDARDTPYINHPIEVAQILVTVGGITEPEVLAAAILHDTIEDTDATREEIEKQFGKVVLDLVLECTDDKSLPKAERKRRQIEHASHKSKHAKCIKTADKISNVKDIGENPPADWELERVQEYLDWTEKVIAGLRGANKELDNLYDETLARSRQLVSKRSKQLKF